MNEAGEPQARTRLYPPGMQPVTLHLHDEAVRRVVESCLERNWAAVTFDADRWTSSDALHQDFARELRFPDHYGYNLDALVDCLGELPQRVAGPTTGDGLVIVFRRFERFLSAEPALAAAVMEIMAEAIINGLQYGWPMALLLQSDDEYLQPPAAPGLHIYRDRSTN